MDLRIPTLKLKNIFESNPLKSRILVWRLAVLLSGQPTARGHAESSSVAGGSDGTTLAAGLATAGVV